MFGKKIGTLLGAAAIAFTAVACSSTDPGLTTAVKSKLAQLKPGLPAGVELVETYDRSQLIQRSVSNLTGKLAEEFIVVALVCFAFLFHLR